MKVKLEDITRYSKGSQINGSELIDDGKYIYLNGGITPSGRWNSYNVDANTVTISEGGNSSGYVNFIAEPFWCGAHCYYLYEGPKNTKYLYYALKSQQERLFAIRSGACMPNIKKADLGKFEIEFESDQKKQNEIVAVLSKAESVIDKRKKEIERLDNLIKARFVELFGDPVHSEKYGTRKLSSCIADKADMVDGPFGSQVNTKVDYIKDGEIPVIRTINVKMMSFSSVDLKYMTREKYETVIRSQVLPGDVILTKVGTIGNVCIFPDLFKEAVLSTTGSCRIRVDNSIVNTKFFAYNLMYLKGKLLEIASAGVQPFLNMNHVKNVDILDVPLAKQIEFVDFVNQVDKSKFDYMFTSYLSISL